MTYQLLHIREGSGFFEVGDAGETLGKHKLVYLDANGNWQLANSTAVATMPCLGITMDAIPYGGRGRILTHGYIGCVSWSWTVGASLYVSAVSGELTETAPTSGYGQVIAHAKKDNLIYLFPWESESADEETPTSFGKLVSLNESGDDITITVGDTYYQHTEIDESVVNDMTYDAVNKGLQVNYAGSYLVSLSMSVSVDSADHRVHIGLGKSGTVGTYNKMDYTSKFANRIHNISFTTITANLALNDLLTAEVTSDTNGDVVSIYHCQLSAVLIDET